jgi:stage IV sporulation protein FB
MISFKFLRIPVNIHPSFWLFLLFFTQIYRSCSWENLIIGIILFVSVLVHEYGHGFAALACGAQPEIDLEGLGGTTKYNGVKVSNKQDFLITVCGPLFESLLIVIPYFILKNSAIEGYYIKYILYMTMKLNILFCLLNLIPLYPLDGGHISRYLLTEKFGEKGLKISLHLGIASALVVGPYLFFKGYLCFAVLLFIYGFKNVQIYRQTRFARTRSNPFSLYNQGLAFLKNEEIENAKPIFKKLMKLKDNSMRISAMESMAKILQKENKAK